MNCTPIFKQVRKASTTLNLLSDDQIQAVLYDIADLVDQNIELILTENKKDLDRMDTSDPKYDRLKLTEERILGITGDMRNVAALPSPLGKNLMESATEAGLNISKVSVPFGVIGIIYEARPNVTYDVFALCLKSGNACILKGGSDAIYSNTASVGLIKQVLAKHNIDENVLTLLPSGREETAQMLNANGYVDLIIPRGSQSLINMVRENATVPVIETGAGICHTYFDETGDTAKGTAIINNAKNRRVSVCNALDCLVLHESRLNDLPELLNLCPDFSTIVYADEQAYSALEGKYPTVLLKKATQESFGTEFLDHVMSVKTVASFSEAIDHIAEYSSKHSEAIVSENKKNTDYFTKMVDAAAVYVNTSTAFTDGAQFGLGAEIGISTQKLHARGPMALEELTSYKWIIESDGVIRNS
ncbi:MAG: glutamate-5-semialdehyde dehydrogenase [Salinivirgaceae bacterium]|jgi:glutamate-5-semialdehyde dehydrogenase|nr:glutamate-5-semialdehyde dehydrogenase [Salinivirgaceae bacterium]